MDPNQDDEIDQLESKLINSIDRFDSLRHD